MYICVCIHTHTHTHYIFFVHSSISAYLACFHVLAIVNSAMHTGVRVSFWIIVLSGCVPKSGSAGSYRNSIFSFLRNLQTASIVATVNYIPTNSVGGFLFLHTLSSICFTHTHTHTHNEILEEEMSTHSSILAWRIPQTVKPGGLQSMGSQRVGQDWSDLAQWNINQS